MCLVCAERRSLTGFFGAISQSSQGGHDVRVCCVSIHMPRVSPPVVHEPRSKRAFGFTLIVRAAAQSEIP
jgi:hypothetical protein